jgi:soluble lytic murein transglycosylase-like protein
MGVRGDLFNIANNLKAGVRYLRWIANDYFKMGADLTDASKLEEGKLKTILASYNAGIGNVRKWIRRMGENLPRIPFAETRDYVAKITDKLSAWLDW